MGYFYYYPYVDLRGRYEFAYEQEAIQKSIYRIWQYWRWIGMAESHELHSKRKIGKDVLQENLLIIVVLVFSFIYFLFQVYLWFASIKI